MIPECLCIASLIGIKPIIMKHLLNIISVKSLIVFAGVINFIFILLYVLFIDRDDILNDLFKIKNDKTAIVLLVFVTFCVFIVIEYATFNLYKMHKAYLIEAVISIYPLITIFFGYVILSEGFSYAHFIGLMLIILGIVTITVL